MKIINARTGNLQQIPFELGEKGTGRWLEEVKLSNRPGQAPIGPEDVSYFQFGEGHKHVILTNSAADPKRGMLLRIDTRGTYTKGSCGKITLKGGRATLLTSAQWAEGAAGYVANGPDQLWHVEGPALFEVIIQGGEHKGMGHRFLIVTKFFETVMIKRAELCQLIATDENPEVTDVCQMFRDALHEDVRQAMDVAVQLDDIEPGTAAKEVNHFFTEWDQPEDLVRGFGLAIPVAMAGLKGGVSGVTAGTLMPGAKALVYLNIGPGGGKRYGYTKYSEAGLTRIGENCGRPFTCEQMLAMVEREDWHCAWEERKDAVVVTYVIANAGGRHRFYPETGRIESSPWFGLPAGQVTMEEFCRVFGLGNGGAKKIETPPPSGGGFGGGAFSALAGRKW